MFLFFGTYARRRALPPTTEPCPHCRSVVAVDWRRVYRTAHFFFFPLFSWGEHTTAGCPTCSFRMIAPHPEGVGPIPLLDRLGFIFAFALFMAVGVFCISFSLARGPGRHVASETALRERLDGQLVRTEAYGQGEGALTIATVAHESIATESALTSCAADVSPRAKTGRRIVLLCEHTALRRLDAAARHEAVAKVQSAVVPLLGTGDHVVVALKGNFMYGVLARGEGAEWVVVNDDDVLPSDIDAAVRGAHTNASRVARAD